MKILLIANTDWYLFRFRLTLAEHLRSQGWDVVCVSPRGEYAPGIQARGFRWVEWQVGRQSTQPWSELAALRRLMRILQTEKPTLIHLHTIKAALYGSLAAWLLGIKAVVRSVTGLGYVFLGNTLRARLIRLVVTGIYRLLFRIGRGITIFENQTDLEFFIRQGFVRPGQAVLIRGVGVDTDAYPPLPEPPGPPAVVMASRLLWDKGVGEFAQAAQMLQQTMTARFILVGQNDPGNPSSISAEQIHAWVQQGILEWWGWQADMRAVFAASHVVTLPSYGEGLPTVLIEAAACGRPLIATDVPGCRDVVQHQVNGLLVPAKNAALLAEAIQRLLTHPEERARMGLQSRRMAEEHFSAKIINAQTCQIYQKLLSSTTPGQPVHEN